MSKHKRLHPIAAVSNFFKSLKELLLPLVAFFAFGSRQIGWEWFQVVAPIGVIFIILISGIISWLRFSYWIEDGELRIEYGLFIRKKRFIPFEKIQSLNLSEGILHRPFGLVKVQVETAGSSGKNDAEAVLTAVTRAEAKAIEKTLISLKNHSLAEEFAEQFEAVQTREEILYKITIKELFSLALTSGGVGVVISAVIAFISQFEEIIPYKRVFKEMEGLLSNGIMFVSIVVFIIFLLAWIIALIGVFINYANFTVKKINNDFVIMRGLLEKKQLTIPLNRIQAIKIYENLVRQPLGYCTVFIESAGGSVQNTESAKVLLLPMIKREKIIEILNPYLPDYQLEVEFQSTPKRSLIRFFIRGLLFIVPIIILAIVLLRPWGYVSLLLIPISLAWSYLKFKDNGWNISEKQLTFRFRSLVKTTVFMRRNKIQSLTLKESYFQTKKELSSVRASVKSGLGASGGAVVDIEKSDALQINGWYSRH